jgi:hypothetical protein
MARAMTTPKKKKQAGKDGPIAPVEITRRLFLAHG